MNTVCILITQSLKKNVNRQVCYKHVQSFNTNKNGKLSKCIEK